MTDGSGGSGLIGDLRKLAKIQTDFANLRSMGKGAAWAVASFFTAFGVLIVTGAIHWVEVIAKAAKE